MADEPSSEPPLALVPAATVVLLRDGADGPEALLLRRNSRLAFAGGHWVFPGGRLEPSDLAGGTLFADLADDAVDDLVTDPDLRAAARRAAARETQEETGLVLDDRELAWFAHWTPPRSGPRRFATWFFVAAAPEGTIEIDGGEIHDHTWMRPGDAHDQRDAGAIELSPPTWVTLWQLRDFTTAADAVKGLADRPPERYTTRMVPVDDHLVALWDGDAGFATGDADRPGPRHRLVMHPDGWRYERDAP